MENKRNLTREFIIKMIWKSNYKIRMFHMRLMVLINKPTLVKLILKWWLLLLVPKILLLFQTNKTAK